MWYINYKTNKEVLTMRKELLKGLTEEQIAKVEKCKSPEEILALAKEEGVELTGEQLEAVSGGGLCKSNKCPNCGSKNMKQKWSHHYYCLDCGDWWDY